jgi:hypothetical protein
LLFTKLTDYYPLNVAATSGPAWWRRRARRCGAV